MTILSIKEKENGPIEIDLTGPQGNAYYILGVAQKLAEQMWWKDWKDIETRMKSGDYENLLQVFDEEFGEHVILYR